MSANADMCSTRCPQVENASFQANERLPAGKHAGHPGIGLLCLSEDLEPGLHQGCRQVRPRGSQPDCRQRGPCRGRGTARRAGSRESRPPGRQRRCRLPPFRSSACFQPAIRSRRLSPVRNRLLRMAMHNRRQVRRTRPKPVPARPRQPQRLMSPFPRPIPRSPGTGRQCRLCSGSPVRQAVLENLEQQLSGGDCLDLDLRGLKCPLPVLKTRRQMRDWPFRCPHPGRNHGPAGSDRHPALLPRGRPPAARQQFCRRRPCLCH
jgi:hypothetical protein